jgi:hypothetical protein
MVGINSVEHGQVSLCAVQGDAPDKRVLEHFVRQPINLLGHYTTQKILNL